MSQDYPPFLSAEDQAMSLRSSVGSMEQASRIPTRRVLRIQTIESVLSM
jgi:hypothetical protein